jgi:hypothetical protein
MTIIGFNFNKIEVSRMEKSAVKVSITNNVTVKDVVLADLSFGSDKQKTLKFIFEFSSKYDPDVGSIILGGEVLFMEESTKVKKIVEDWKKNKSLDKELMASILNTVLVKCNIQALILSQEVNLPSPIPLPKVKMDVEVADKKK